MRSAPAPPRAYFNCEVCNQQDGRQAEHELSIGDIQERLRLIIDLSSEVRAFFLFLLVRLRVSLSFCLSLSFSLSLSLFVTVADVN